MRTRDFLPTFILAAAWLMGSPQWAWAPVGYVNTPLRQGWTLIANPLRLTPTNNANFIMPTAPDGTALYRFDWATQTYRDAATFFTGFGWNPLSGDTNDPALVINPGEGFWVESPQAWTNTFIGEIITGTNLNPILATYNLKANIEPVGGLLQSALSFPSRQDDTVWNWTGTAVSSPPYAFASSWSPSEPSLGVGEGFIVWRDPGQAVPANYWRTVLNLMVGPPPGASAGPGIQSITITGGEVILDIGKFGAGGYNILYSPDRIIWITVASNQTGKQWRTPFPGGGQGYYDAVNP